MVRAILAGTKTQTRRVVKSQPTSEGFIGHYGQGRPFFRVADKSPVSCPYGAPGDRLWVRETFCPIYSSVDASIIEVDYRATYKHGDRLGDSLGIKKRWSPSIHMHRSLSRITLEVTGVRVERLQGISNQDARAEGVLPEYAEACIDLGHPFNAIPRFRTLWGSINGPDSWGANPRVWVVEFRRVQP
jgi:hypothetical protein